tara:strand:- start:206 stop:712 length:507 start_codon:yes stop_codon:yes gene_type:complete
MNKNQKNVEEFMEAASQKGNAYPSEISQKDAELRVILLLEEVLEFSAASGVEVKLDFDKTNGIIRDTNDLVIKKVGEVDLVEIADGVGDINYVSEGAALAYGIDMEPIHEEIQRSNMSKFIDGHRREDGKWVKGPSYSPADIKSIIEAQIAAGKKAEIKPVPVETGTK